MAENQDIAVLGFTVKTTNAENALNEIDRALTKIDDHMETTDEKLEQTVVNALNKLATASKTLGKPENAEAINNVVKAFQGFAEMTQTMKDMPNMANGFKEAVAAMQQSGLDKLLQGYRKSLEDVHNAFSGDWQKVSSGLASIKDAIAADDMEQRIKNLSSAIQNMQDAYVHMNRYVKGEQLLPKGVILDDVKTAQDGIGTLIEAMTKYIEVRKLMDAPRPVSKANDQYDPAQHLLENLTKAGEQFDIIQSALNGDLKDKMANILPGGIQTLRLRAEVTNLKQIQKELTLQLIVSDNSTENFRTVQRIMTQMPSSVSIVYNDEQVAKLKQQLTDITPKFDVTEDAISKLKSAITSKMEGFTVPINVAPKDDSDAVTKIREALTANVEGMTVRPATINVSPNTILVDRTDSVMKFKQNELFMPVDAIQVTPQTLWVDRSQAEIKLLQAQLVTDWADVIVHPTNVLVDVSALTPDKIMMLGGLKNTFDVQAGTARLAPKVLKLDPDAMAGIDVQAWTKTVKVAAPVLIKPSSLKVEQSALNNALVALDQPIRIKTYMTAMGEIMGIYKKMAPVAQALAEAMKGINDALSADMKDMIKIVSASGGKIGGKVTDILDEYEQLSYEAEKLEKQDKAWNKLLKLETDPVDEKKSKDRIESFKKLREEMEKTQKESGNYAENKIKQDKDQEDADAKLKKGKKELENQIHNETDTWRQNADAIRTNAQIQFDNLRATASTNAALKAAGTELRTFSWRLDNLPRIQPTTLTDPFVRLKAELGETNSRLVDLSRTFGLYLTGRSIVNYFRQASESANNFQLEIRRIQSLAMDFDFGKLRDGLMDIDARFGNVTHNAQALYWAYSSGVRGTEQDLTKFVEIMSKTGTTIKADVMPTMDAATALLNAFNLNASSANEIADLLFATIKYGKSNAQQLTTSLGHVVAPAAALNVELDELGATIATLTKTMKTNRALTYLSNILGRMAAPTKEVQEAAAELGIELSANSIKAKGFANTLREIRDATNGDIGKIARLFPDLRSQRAALTLLGTQFGDFEKQLTNMKNKAGSMEEALSKITDTPEMQLRALRNTFSMIGIEAGNAANSVMTLGGALSPILKWINGLEHSGRALIGNFVAAAAATKGIAMAGKAFAVAQYAALQTSYQMASAAADVHKLEMDNSILKERQALEGVKLLAATMKQEVAQKQLNDTTLRELKIQDEIYRKNIEQNKLSLQTERMRMQFVNERMKRGFDDQTAKMGESQSRIAYFGQWLSNLQTGEGQRKIRNTQNLIARLNADLQADRALLQGEQDNLAKNYRVTIENMVEHSSEIRKLMHEAIQKGDIGKTEDLNSFYGKLISTIKSNSEIASQMAQYDTDERILNLEIRRYMIAKESKSLVTDENYQHSLLVQWVQDEISQEKAKLGVMQANLRTMMQSNATSEETRKLMDSIMQKQLDISAKEAEHKAIKDMIKTRTDELVGREADQVKMLAEAANLAKQVLDADTTDLQTLKNKAEIEMKNAAIVGGNTLNAVRDAFNLQMASQSVQMKINSLLAERATLIDAEGRMINESEEASKRVLEIDKEKNKLQAERNRLQREFIAQGVLAGNQDARNLKMLEMIASGATRAAMVDAMQRDSKVVSEAIKAMSKDIGKGLFGGFTGGGFMRYAPWAMSAIPGMQKMAMPLSMMSSLNIVGKTTEGFSRLTGTLLKTFEITERLQKKGFLSMNATVEALTKSILKSNVTLKGFKLTMDSLKGLGAAGGIKGLAGAGSLAAGGTFALGVAIIGAISAGLYYALSKTDRGGPFADIAEKIYGVDTLKKQGEYLKMRNEMMRAEHETNQDMIRELNRMISATTNIQDSLINITERNRMLEALDKLSKQPNIAKYHDKMQARKEEIEQLEQELVQIRAIIKAMRSPRDKKIFKEQGMELVHRQAELMRLNREDEAFVRQEYDAWVSGVAEKDYQSLRERLEADRDSAFMPKRDMQGRYELASKQVNLAMSRLSDLLGKNGELANLADVTTDEMHEMVRKIIMDLSGKKTRAGQKLNDAKKELARMKSQGLDVSDQEQKVSLLEEEYNKALKAYDDKSQNIQNTFKDLYSNLINRADAYVKSQLDLVKQMESNAKYNALFDSVDMSFKTQEKSILTLRDTMKKLQDDFASKSGIFKTLGDEERENTFRDRVKEVGDAIKSSVSKRVGDIKSMMTQTTTFMESLANEMQQLDKSRFDFRMSNSLFAGNRLELIKNRMGMLDKLLFGDGVEGGVLSMRDKALEEMRRLQGLGDLPGALKQMQEARKWQQQAYGLEQQRLDLIKIEADKQREINGSLYQLANTLRGQFQATSQQAIEADSVEAIRLRSRAFNENIAPSISNDANMKLAEAYEKMLREYAKKSDELKQAADDLTEELRKASGRKDVLGNEANMSTEINTFKTAVDTFNRVIQNSQTIIQVKRI